MQLMASHEGEPAIRPFGVVYGTHGVLTLRCQLGSEKAGKVVLRLLGSQPPEVYQV